MGIDELPESARLRERKADDLWKLGIRIVYLSPNSNLLSTRNNEWAN